MVTMCQKCGSDDFSPSGKCRPCHAAAMRAYYEDPERRAKKNAQGRERRALHGAEIAARVRARRAERPEEVSAYRKTHYERNKALIIEQGRASRARQRARDPDAYKAKMAARAKARRDTIPEVKISGRISTRVRQSLKGCKYRRSWEILVGYSVADLIAHLMTTMPDGYEWQDYLDARLEVDHIRPVASFTFASADDPEFRACWALSNLQLLPALENNRKNARVV